MGPPADDVGAGSPTARGVDAVCLVPGEVPGGNASLVRIEDHLSPLFAWIRHLNLDCWLAECRAPRSSRGGRHLARLANLDRFRRSHAFVAQRALESAR